MFMKNEYLSVKDAAALLGVTPLTIRNWDSRGRLTAYRHPINNYRMFKKSDVEAILADFKPREKRSKSGLRKLSVAYEDEVS